MIGSQPCPISEPRQVRGIASARPISPEPDLQSDNRSYDDETARDHCRSALFIDVDSAQEQKPDEPLAQFADNRLEALEQDFYQTVANNSLMRCEKRTEAGCERHCNTGGQEQELTA